jgi:hypothetical protein
VDWKNYKSNKKKPLGLSWSKQLRLLEVHIGYDTSSNIEEDFDNKIVELKKLLKYMDVKRFIIAM